MSDSSKDQIMITSVIYLREWQTYILVYCFLELNLLGGKQMPNRL